MAIRVLIVDDSALMRKLLQARLGREDDIEVVGLACDAQEARSLIKALNPDVVTLDIEMPGMDGLSFLQKIMQLRPTPVIIVSGTTREGDRNTVRALQLGAISCYAKSEHHSGGPGDDGGALAALVREAAQVSFGKTASIAPSTPAANANPQPAARREPARLVALGASTGGVEALCKLLAQFPRSCPPTVIVQHVNARFAPAIAHSLDSSCPARVVLAESDMPLEQGTVYLAPGGDRHMLVATAGTLGHRVVLRQGPEVSGHKPSVDVLFGSVAEVFGAEAVGALLTGMGQDGARGLLKMQQKGAHTIAQDADSCVVYGMPRAAVEMGAARKIVPLERIAGNIFAHSEVAREAVAS
ncbi:protein-glutamate methylesterase/protein-glutamine glutaminase [Aurantiacibacter flavus]|uniref:Protein-glutamate methylesterase/protein-glutamine glutaminase n=1 Tax=Aurantiacibacter flavus TaxID=3145232 RepID=A0ABV0CZL2_9SPHN